MSESERIVELEQKVEALEIALQRLLEKLSTGFTWQELKDGISLSACHTP